jgi:hypothetical protein
MAKFLGFLATLKITLITASVAFACGEILPVILISALFSLVQLNAKPAGGILPQGSAIISPSDGRRAA